MRRRTVIFAADLDTLRYPVPVRRDLGQAHRGKHGDAQPQTFARMAMTVDQAPVLDAANRNGFAAAALTAAMAELYPDNVDRN